MAQDTTPSIIMYQGGTNTFPVPFDKGYYGEVKVLFVRRGAIGYEYEPASSNYVVNGRLYAWGAGSNYIYTHTPTPAVGAPTYNDQDVDSGKKVETTAGQTITVDGVSYVRATQHDISNHLILTWNGEELGADDYICIGRDTERGQPYSLPNNQKHIEGALDNIERQVQELKDKTDNALVIDPTHTIDASKMGPIDWLETIVRSTDKTARAIRYHNGYLQFSLEAPDVPLDQKTWTSILNTINVTTIREWYDEEKNEYRLQYSKDNGVSWKEIPFTVSSIPGLESRLVTIENEQAVLRTGVKGNAEAIQKTRGDYIAADGEIRRTLDSHTSELATLRGNQASLGDQVAGIEGKIPESASGANPLITKQQLFEEEMDIRKDLNSGLSELQTQVTAQAAKIETKQDKLTAGDNIIISNNVISATGAGGGAGFDVVVVQELPATGQKGIIYLLAKDGAAPDVHDEYVWITATQTFELIGSTQVDLTDYVKNTDYAASGKAGLVVVSRNLGTATNVAGYLQTYTLSLEEYKELPSFIFIGKGTLENIKDDLVARAIAESVTTKDLTVGTDEGTLNIGITAGVATIATNNGLDIAAQTKFDTAPTTDDNTTYADALEVSFMRKAQVATAIADAVANVDALPDQSGNAGKVLMTDGSKASWQEAPAGGTKVIIKRYE